MFDCGINEIVSNITSSIETEKEKMILKAVQSVGIDVDKEQLEKALFNAKSFYIDGYKDAKKQYEPRWIPVSERLPEEEGKYLTTDSLGNIGITKFFSLESEEMPLDFYLWNATKNCVNRYEKDDVIAWMPLAEPYKESEQHG